MKKSSSNTNPSFDYFTLCQTYPELTHCSFFQNQQELISLMGDCVDREMANSQRGTAIETEAAFQSHYIEWARLIGIPDPCGPNVGYQRIVVIYVKFLQSGVNYCNCNTDNLQSMTLLGYAKAINTLFTLRAFKPPVNLNNENNMRGTLINNLT